MAIGNRLSWFQHTAARRRLEITHSHAERCFVLVSTHSRPKAAGLTSPITDFDVMFQHTAARRRLVESVVFTHDDLSVSTHSRPKAAGQARCRKLFSNSWFQHTAARRRLVMSAFIVFGSLRFQHTAARRRLADDHVLSSVV